MSHTTAPDLATYDDRDLADDLRWWAAANYLTVAQIYLKANPLLRRPLTADDIKPRLRVPTTAKKGELIEVKTLITHPMETGLRKDSEGKIVPRQIVNALSVTYNGKPVLNARLEPAVAANPYLAFFVKVEESGTLKFTWTDDNKQSWSAESKIEVT